MPEKTLEKMNTLIKTIKKGYEEIKKEKEEKEKGEKK
jgi:hypothetical protein